MFTIHLNKLRFFAHHGLHDEEAITGTEFEIDVSVEFEPGSPVVSISQTINYVDIYHIIQKYMEHPVALLEILAEQISADIYKLDNRIKLINININKLYPPITHFIGNVGVSYTKVF